VIRNYKGNIVKQIALNGNRNGTVNIETAKLIAGTYPYSLIIDGKEVDTKWMLIAR
jgi:hypothetical protein